MGNTLNEEIGYWDVFVNTHGEMESRWVATCANHGVAEFLALRLLTELDVKKQTTSIAPHVN